MGRKYRKRNGDTVEKTLILFDNFTHKLMQSEDQSLTMLVSKAIRKAYSEKDRLIKFFLNNASYYSKLRKQDKLYYTKIALTVEEARMLDELAREFEKLLGTKNESETVRRVLFYYMLSN